MVDVDGLAVPRRLQPARGPRPPPDRLQGRRRRCGRSSSAWRSTRSSCRTRCPTGTGCGGPRSTSANTTSGSTASRSRRASTCRPTRSSSTRSSRDRRSRGGRAAYDLPHAVALYERDGGSLWDRTDPATFERDARFARELVVTASMVIGNYTYMIDYVFRLDGSDRRPRGRDRHDAQPGHRSQRHRRAIRRHRRAEHLGAEPPALLQLPDRLRRRRSCEPARRGRTPRACRAPSATPSSTTETAITTEGFRDINPTTTRHWAVESTTAQNALGEPTAYEIEPHEVARAYVRPVFEPLQHAPFAQHALWVTRFKDGELFAGGDYPNQAPGGRGSAEVRLRSRQRRRQGPRGLVHGGLHPSHSRSRTTRS